MIAIGQAADPANLSNPQDPRNPPHLHHPIPTPLRHPLSNFFFLTDSEPGIISLLWRLL
jgi:hypothetical protein